MKRHTHKTKRKDGFKRPKEQMTAKGRKGICTCTSRAGDVKTLYSQRWIASRRAGDTMEPGKMWEIYKCPSGGDGYHIATVRWDPWKNSPSLPLEEES